MADCPKFPFISESDFVQACREIQQDSDSWSLLLTTTPILRTRRTVQLCGEEEYEATHEAQDMDEDEVVEADDGALALNRGKPSVILTYDILLSPSYRVPVVYIHAMTSSGIPCRRDALQLSKLVVPEPWRAAVEGTGIIGAITTTDHPVTGLPTYFVHPCRTAEALSVSSERKRISSIDYMMLWFGIIGTSVGLTIPMETALRSRETK